MTNRELDFSRKAQTREGGHRRQHNLKLGNLPETYTKFFFSNDTLVPDRNTHEDVMNSRNLIHALNALGQSDPTGHLYAQRSIFPRNKDEIQAKAPTIDLNPTRNELIMNQTINKNYDGFFTTLKPVSRLHRSRLLKLDHHSRSFGGGSTLTT